MGVVLEIGKLVDFNGTWVYQNWKETNVLLKSYLVSVHSSFDVNHKYGYIWIPIKVTH